MTFQKLMAAAMATLLASCSTARQELPARDSPADLAHFVLVIQEQPDGALTHSWQPAERFELATYQRQAGNDGTTPRPIPASTRSRDCDQENQDCYRRCMDRPLPPGYGGFTSPRKRGGKSEFCRGECQRAYDDCLELERLRPQEFSAVEGVGRWLKRHRTEVLVGSILVIAGTTFVVVSAGAGLIVLAPVLLVTELEARPEVPVAKGLP